MLRRVGLAAALAWIGLVAGAGAQTLFDLAPVLAPTGMLRAAINLGNPVLAQPGQDGPKGVSVDLAREFARRLGREVKLVVYDGAGRVTDAAGANQWDIAFLAIDPVRGREIDYTAPYVVIEGAYLVPDGSALRQGQEVDRPGIRVGVSGKSAYDLFLTRELKAATLVRFGSAQEALEALRAGTLDVLAGVRQQVEGFAAASPGMRLLPGRFMAIEQALAVPKGREAALPALKAFVEDAKASGFVAKGLSESGQSADLVAPPAR